MQDTEATQPGGPSLLSYGDEVRGTYRVEGHIGAGAFGDVYLVRHRYMGMQAMKILGRSASEEDLQTGLNEAFLLSRLSHPNIVRVFEANHVKDDPDTPLYVTMEYVDGETVRELIDECGGSIEIDRALKLLCQAAAGLAHAHACDPRVVHRDIRPENLLLKTEARDQTLLIGDFGMAGPVNKAFGFLERAGAIVYESPEGLDGYEGPRSDVFSLGLVFYELLTGVFPYPRSSIFDSSTDETLVARLKEAQRVGIKEATYFRSAIPVELAALLDVMVSVDLQQRFTSGVELHQAVQLVVECHDGGGWDEHMVDAATRSRAHQLLVTGMRNCFTADPSVATAGSFKDAAAIHPALGRRLQPLVRYEQQEDLT